MITSTKRIVRAGFVGFWRNAYVSIASIFVMMVALFVIGTAIFVDQLLTASLQNIQSRVDINVYFHTTAPTDDILNLQAQLEELPEVASVAYTSRDRALAQYRDRNRNEAAAIQALEELDENPLGASLAIQAIETAQYEAVARYLDEQEQYASIISSVNFADNRDAIERLTGIISAVENTTFLVMIVLMVASVLITFNTIRLAIYTTRNEIGVMRLVGANNMFIRGPFMLQGIMYGIIAGFLALSIIYPMALWLGPKTESFFEFNLYDYFMTDIFLISGVLIGVGVVMGLLSSTMAVAKYLKI